MRIGLLTFLLGLVGSPIISYSQQPYSRWVNGYDTGGSEGHAVVADGNGNVYSTGNFDGSIEVSSISGDYTLTSTGWNSCLIQKMNSSGEIVWVRSLTGTGYAFGYGITVDNSENVYVTGYFSGSIDFDPNGGDNTITSVGGKDIFILKLDSDGNLVWVRALEGSGSTESQANSITLDNAGNLIISGEFDGTMDFDGDVGTENKTSSGSTDIFTLKLNSDGDFIWVQAFEGNTLDNCYSVCIDGSDNILLTGRFHGTVDFDPGVGVDNRTALSGFGDIYTLKLDQNGNLLWANTYGGTNNEFGESVEVDNDGNVYTFGRFRETVDFDPSGSTYNMTSAGNQDAFIQKVDPLGNLLWVKTFGGLYSAFAQSIALDTDANMYLCGFFSDTIDLDPSGSVAEFTALSTFSNGFISKLDSSGEFVWGCVLPSISSVTPRSICVDENANVLVTGRFSETVDFDPTGDTLELSSTFGSVFVVKYEEGFTSIDEMGNSAVLSAYPNPTNGSLKIKALFDFKETSLYASNGSRIDFNNDCYCSEQEIDISELPQGIYILKVVSKNSTFSTRIVKY